MRDVWAIGKSRSALFSFTIGLFCGVETRGANGEFGTSVVDLKKTCPSASRRSRVAIFFLAHAHKSRFGSSTTPRSPKPNYVSPLLRTDYSVPRPHESNPFQRRLPTDVDSYAHITKAEEITKQIWRGNEMGTEKTNERRLRARAGVHLYRHQYGLVGFFYVSPQVDEKFQEDSHMKRTHLSLSTGHRDVDEAASVL